MVLQTFAKEKGTVSLNQIHGKNKARLAVALDFVGAYDLQVTDVLYQHN